MNEHIFQSLIDNITQLYSVSEKELFNNEKNYESVERRQLFFYLCSKKNIPAVTIQKYLAKKDYNIHHSNILRGINRISTKVEQSEDYQNVISKLEFIGA